MAQVLDELRARDQVRGEDELEQAEWRLAELLRDRPTPSELHDADGRRASARRPDPGSRFELRVAVGIETPESDPFGTRELECQAKHVCRAVRRVRPGGKGVRCHAK